MPRSRVRVVRPKQSKHIEVEVLEARWVPSAPHSWHFAITPAEPAQAEQRSESHGQGNGAVVRDWAHDRGHGPERAGRIDDNQHPGRAAPPERAPKHDDLGADDDYKDRPGERNDHGPAIDGGGRRLEDIDSDDDSDHRPKGRDDDGPQPAIDGGGRRLEDSDKHSEPRASGNDKPSSPPSRSEDEDGHAARPAATNTASNRDERPVAESQRGSNDAGEPKVVSRSERSERSEPGEAAESISSTEQAEQPQLSDADGVALDSVAKGEGATAQAAPLLRPAAEVLARSAGNPLAATGMLTALAATHPNTTAGSEQQLASPAERSLAAEADAVFVSLAAEAAGQDFAPQAIDGLMDLDAAGFPEPGAVERLFTVLADWANSDVVRSAVPWLAAAALAMSAGELARRQLRRAVRQQPTIDPELALFGWLPEATQ